MMSAVELTEKRTSTSSIFAFPTSPSPQGRTLQEEEEERQLRHELEKR
jgi:hypothetical protein